MLPCIADSPDVELDVLDKILEEAVAAIPDALRIGRAVISMDAGDIYRIREKILQACGEKLSDSRLATHYAMLTACALQVRHCAFLYRV